MVFKQVYSQDTPKILRGVGSSTIMPVEWKMYLVCNKVRSWWMAFNQSKKHEHYRVFSKKYIRLHLKALCQFDWSAYSRVLIQLIINQLWIEQFQNQLREFESLEYEYDTHNNDYHTCLSMEYHTRIKPYITIYTIYHIWITESTITLKLLETSWKPQFLLAHE